jgi:SAM-dependent methyltransferase
MPSMSGRRVLILAGFAALGAAAAVVGRQVLTSSRSAAPDGAEAISPPGGWATCSAPSARWYDLTFGWLLGGLYARMADDLAAALAGVAAPDVLEVGPGPGGLAVELARRVDGLRLTGLDIDAAMVERANARARREGLGDRLTFVVGDVATLPFPDASFDLVTSSFSAHHWPDAAAGFAEIRRVLRPGGRAIVYDLPDRWGHAETKAIPAGTAAAAGGFEGAGATPFRWPASIALVRRLEVSTPEPPQAAAPELRRAPGGP